jgi:hypothetical protein
LPAGSRSFRRRERELRSGLGTSRSRAEGCRSSPGRSPSLGMVVLAAAGFTRTTSRRTLLRVVPLSNAAVGVALNRREGAFRRQDVAYRPRVVAARREEMQIGLRESRMGVGKSRSDPRKSPSANLGELRAHRELRNGYTGCHTDGRRRRSRWRRVRFGLGKTQSDLRRTRSGSSRTRIGRPNPLNARPNGEMKCPLPRTVMPARWD